MASIFDFLIFDMNTIQFEYTVFLQIQTMFFFHDKFTDDIVRVFLVKQIGILRNKIMKNIFDIKEVYENSLLDLNW